MKALRNKKTGEIELPEVTSNDSHFSIDGCDYQKDYYSLIEVTILPTEKLKEVIALAYDKGFTHLINRHSKEEIIQQLLTGP